MFRKALHSSLIRLRVIRRLQQKQTVTQPGKLTSGTVEHHQSGGQQSAYVKMNGVARPSDVASTPAVKLPPAVPPRNASTSLSAAKSKFTQISSTRLIGKVMNVELTKGDKTVSLYPAQSSRQLIRLKCHYFDLLYNIQLSICCTTLCRPYNKCAINRSDGV